MIHLPPPHGESSSNTLPMASHKTEWLNSLSRAGFYGIADPGPAGNCCPIRIAEALISAGCPIIQLRMKDAGADNFLRTATVIRNLTRATGVALVINDRIDIALMCQADGVHLGQDDIPVEEARQLLGRDAIIGLSTHNIEQVKYALQQRPDYLGFGPVFPSLTKPGVLEERGLSKLQEAVRVAGGLPIVAIGGINMNNIGAILATGCHAGAPIGAITEHADAFEASLQMMAAARRKH